MPHVGVTVYDLLLSCPGDVVDLKDTIDACVKSFNVSIGEANNIRIQLKHWSTDSFSQSGDKPQNILNKQFVNDCDLCVALLGIRFGTPTDNYDSGTEEEIEKMLEQGKQVFLYFVERTVDPSNIDLEQYKKVQEFKNKYTDKGVYTVVKCAEELRSCFQNALSLYFIKLVAPNTAQLPSRFAPNLVISSTADEGMNIASFYTCYQEIPLVKNKEDAIKELIEEISTITIPRHSEKYLEDLDSKISDEELQEMTVGDIKNAYKNKIISNNQLHLLMGTEPPVYRKIEIDEYQRSLISAFCENHDIYLNGDFYFLGNLQETEFSLISVLAGTNKTYLGDEIEQKKYKLIEKLLDNLEEYNDMIKFLRSIDSMPCVCLQIENKGSAFDEDIDIKLFIEKGCFADIDNIPKPGSFFLEEAVELKIPKELFRCYHDSDIEDFTNYPSYYIPQKFNLPFKSRCGEIDELRKEYHDMMKCIFCYDIRENKEEDILCFNIPYLKQNTKMFFPSYLFFTKKPKNLRYEIRSKHSPEVYKGILELVDRSDEN